MRCKYKHEGRRIDRRPLLTRMGQLVRLIAISTASSVLLLAGCSNSTPPSGSPVTTGNQTNSLPAPPAQQSSNRYAALDVLSNIDVNLEISHPGNSFDYEQIAPPGQATISDAGGTLTPLVDFDFLSRTDTSGGTVFSQAGLSAENESDAVLLYFQQGSSFQIGVPVAETGCLAPDGAVKFNFLSIPLTLNAISGNAGNGLTYNGQSDALYGSGSLSYNKTVFSFSNVEQKALGGATAATNTIPFADSYCIQSLDGYALQSKSVQISSQNGVTTSANLEVYLGPTGTMAAAVKTATASSGTTSAGPTMNFVGAVQPAGAIDLSDVIQHSYKGFYEQPQSGTSLNVAYFGKSSKWLKTPVFTQPSTGLIGGNGIFNASFSPAPIHSNILFDFGAQDSVHYGLFPNATLKEQDPQKLCKPAQQSIGTDGNTYCTFPIAALIEKSYGKYVIFFAGPEPTTNQSLFYALVQD